MMENIEKFWELVSRKDELNEKEKAQLEYWLSNDKEAAELYRVYKFTEEGVKKSYHPTIDEISDYVLYLNGEEPEDNSIISKAPQIELHLRNCRKCHDIFLDFNDEHSEASAFVDSNYGYSEKKPADVIISRRTPVFRYSTISILTVFVLFIGSLMVYYMSTPQVYRLADIDKSTVYITRGRTTADFERGIEALDNNNYNEAIKFFKDDITNHQNDRSVFYTSYILGLTYLESSEKSIVGMFNSYDQAKVKQGIHYLEEAIAKNNSGSFPNLNYDAQFYLGKAYLMMNNKPKALEYFRSVVASKGSKMEEADKILSELK